MERTRKKYEELTVVDDFMFGKGRHIYHFENLCREDSVLRLDDGTEKIFLIQREPWMMWMENCATC